MILHGRNKGFRFCIFPGYNWCGPGCSGPGAPINDLDAACKAHDECYRTNANRRICDREFLQRVQPMVNPYTQQGRHAKVIYNAIRFKTFFD